MKSAVKDKIKKNATKLLGILCIIVGAVGVFLPLVPGLVLIGFGLYLLYLGDEEQKNEV